MRETCSWLFHVTLDIVAGMWYVALITRLVKMKTSVRNIVQSGKKKRRYKKMSLFDSNFHVFVGHNSKIQLTGIINKSGTDIIVIAYFGSLWWFKKCEWQTCLSSDDFTPVAWLKTGAWFELRKHLIYIDLGLHVDNSNFYDNHPNSINQRND